MNDIGNYADIGIVHFMAFPNIRDDEGFLKSIYKIVLDPYFNCIEITAIPDVNLRTEVKRILKTSGIKVVYGCQPLLLREGLNLNSLEPEKRKEAVRVVLEGIDDAYDLGARSLAFLSGVYDSNKINAHIEALTISTLEILEYAKKYEDMNVVLEIFDHNVDKKSLIGPSNRALDYIRKVEERICISNFGFMVDLSHIPLIGEGIVDNVKSISHYIKHAHIGNCIISDPNDIGFGDKHPRFGFPNSSIGLPEIKIYLEALLDIGYLDNKNIQILSFEVKPFEDEDPDVVVASSKRYLQNAWRSIHNKRHE